MCLGLQTIYDPHSQRLDAECPTCHGAGWVDLSLVCYCGRAATFADLKGRWYCGAAVCEPEKHPRQNEEASRRAAGFAPSSNVTILSADDSDAMAEYYRNQGIWY